MAFVNFGTNVSLIPKIKKRPGEPWVHRACKAHFVKLTWTQTRCLFFFFIQHDAVALKLGVP